MRVIKRFLNWWKNCRNDDILLFLYGADAFSFGFLSVLSLFLLGHAFLLLSYVIFRLVYAFFVYVRMLVREIRHYV